MITLRPAGQRGHIDFGWLDTHHSFSFGSYHDPRHMSFGHLRVLNEDRVQAGAGFGTHGHRNMEIVSYVVSGMLGHKDSTGSSGIIRPGEVQVMRAGSGIRHSEMNGSQQEPVHFLQIWVAPAETGTPPEYAQKDFGTTQGLVLLVSPDGRNGSLSIGQDIDIWRVLLSSGEATRLPLRRPRAWVQVVRGEIEVNGARLRPGDGAALDDLQALDIVAHANAEALLFDLL